MDQLNLQPNAITTADSTQEIEGYDNHIEEINQAYPEEDFRTPAEKATQEQANQQQQPQPQGEQQPQPVDQVNEVANQVADQLGLLLDLRPQ